MIGDQQDMLVRLRHALPTGWFPDDAPVLTGVLSGLAAGWSWAYGLLQYVRAQTRIASASDIWLDVIAQDFFGVRLRRRVGQSDDAFRTRIRRELCRERGTRAALVGILQDLTGRQPVVFEPARTTDTGGYGNGIAYGIAGGWGSLALPFQCFVTAFRPLGNGIATVAGWGVASGAYGIGTIEYASLEMVQGQVTDQDIYATVAEVLPAATIGWTAIAN